MFRDYHKRYDKGKGKSQKQSWFTTSPVDLDHLTSGEEPPVRGPQHFFG